MRCQSKVNCNSQLSLLETREFARAVAAERGRRCMTDSTDVSDVKMTRFGNRVYLFRKRHVRVKDEAKIASRGTDWDDIIAER